MQGCSDDGLICGLEGLCRYVQTVEHQHVDGEEIFCWDMLPHVRYMVVT